MHCKCMLFWMQLHCICIGFGMQLHCKCIAKEKKNKKKKPSPLHPL